MTTKPRVRLFSRTLLASTLLGIASTGPGFALWEAADGEVFLSLEAAVSADSNIGSNSLELSDTVYSVTPGVSWERSRGLGTITLGAQCEIERASEYESYDSENWSGNFSLDMPATPAGKLRGGFSANYFDGSRVNAFQNTRIAETAYDLALRGSYQVTAKLNSRVGATYARTEPEELAEYTRNSLTFGLGYNYRPDVSAFMDVRFTDSSSSGFEGLGGTDTSGNAVMFGLDGQLSAKLSGSIGLGYDWSETDAGALNYDYSGPSYDASLTWQPRERTSITLEAQNGIQSTSTGGTEYYRVGLSLTQTIGLNVSANAAINFRNSDFADEARGSDEVMDATIGARYAVTRNVSLGLSYTYTDADSSNLLTNYTRSVWRFYGSARF